MQNNQSHHDPFNELENLVKNHLKLKKIVFFAPGLIFFLLVFLILIFSTVTFSGVVINLNQNLSPMEKSLAQGFGLILMTLFIILPQILIFKGKKKIRNVVFIYSLLLNIFNMFFLIYLKDTFWTLPLVITLTLTLISTFLINSISYKKFCEYYFLIQKLK